MLQTIVEKDFVESQRAYRAKKIDFFELLKDKLELFESASKHIREKLKDVSIGSEDYLTEKSKQSSIAQN